MTTHTLTDAARRIAAQLDARGNRDLTGLPETLCRALKVQEEAGEMAQAVIGVLGQNPRKGVTHTWDDVVAEAIDVALSALVLAETVQPGRLGLTVTARLAHLRQRAAASGAPDSGAEQPQRHPVDDLERQRAATLRWLLDAHTEHGLPLPKDIDTYGGHELALSLDEDRPEDVHRWAALLGATVEEPREVCHSGHQWVKVRAQRPYQAEPHHLGWQRVTIGTVCNYRPIDTTTPAAVAA